MGSPRRGGHQAALPGIRPEGQQHRPNTWVSFDEALQAYQRPAGGTFSGIGVGLLEENGIVEIDLDKCVNPVTGAIEPWAQDVVNRINSYTEISPSGTGLRIFLFAKLPSEGWKRGHFECYSSGCYLTIMGNQVPGTPTTVSQCQSEMDVVHHQIFGEWLAKRHQVAVTATPAPLGLDDTAILERTFQSKTGTAFQALYDGNTDAHPSTSEADLALWCRILFRTAGDLVQADRLFRSSGLFRPKWDKRHGALTYGELTLINTLQQTAEFYNPKANPWEPGSADNAWLSIEEIDALLGTGLAEGFHKTSENKNVVDTVRRSQGDCTVFATFRSRAKDGGKRSTVWSDAIKEFPYIMGVKPLTKSTALYFGKTQQMAVVDLLSNTWRNPINAQCKRRKISFNVLPKMRTTEVYCWRVPVDDWTDQAHKALKQRLNSAGAEFLWVDNGLRHGHYLYLDNVQLKGWEMVSDLTPVLVNALKGISPPGRDQDEEGRFRPIGGSRGWYGGAMNSPEEDAGRWHVIAKSASPTDWIQVEAELVASAIRYQQVDEYWNGSQWGPGIVADFATEQEALDFAVSIGYVPRAINLAGAAV